MASKTDLQSGLVLAVVLVGAYAVYRLTSIADKAAGAVSDALTHTGEAVGSAVFDLFHPDQAGEMLFYSVTFAGPVGDGVRHSVPSRGVDSSGYFVQGATWGDGKTVPMQMRRRWRIYVDRETQAKVARPA